ncbi:hypothetical protein EVAR_65392_1, partial [Eumeta japonica]
MPMDELTKFRRPCSVLLTQLERETTKILNETENIKNAFAENLMNGDQIFLTLKTTNYNLALILIATLHTGSIWLGMYGPYDRTAIIIDTRIETNETRIGIESRNKIGVVVDSDRPVDVKDERSHARVIIVERTPPGVTGESKIQLRHSQRIMLPMVLYWAFTEHKTRSSTVEHAVVYLSSNHSAAG